MGDTDQQELPHPGDEGHDSPVRFTPPDTPELRALFAGIPERGTGDQLMRTAQQHHVSLSVMADTKSSIIITVSSIVLTIALGRINDPHLRVSMLILMGFTLAALLLAILAVLPKYRPLRLKRDEPLPPHFNILFFGHFAELDQQRFLRELASRMQPGSIYPIMAADIYSLGSYLSHHKYRYLRLSYICFLLGFVLAVLVQAVKLLS
ncbi:MAG: hypothetical protein JSS44_00670 [Proteobacteria bacterium]|nr:hypothetical protein [Pseudomonadota bacterium]MBS0461251.1 hypothetical protein [Pseudomonadota bacterium]MBS0465083.1 hypothetical protein [Pseudomonadota bacterium]